MGGGFVARYTCMKKRGRQCKGNPVDGIKGYCERVTTNPSGLCWQHERLAKRLANKKRVRGQRAAPSEPLAPIKESLGASLEIASDSKNSLDSVRQSHDSLGLAAFENDINALTEMSVADIGKMILLSESIRQTMSRHPSTSGLADHHIRELADRHARMAALDLARKRALAANDESWANEMFSKKEMEELRITTLQENSEMWREFYNTNAADLGEVARIDKLDENAQAVLNEASLVFRGVAAEFPSNKDYLNDE